MTIAPQQLAGACALHLAGRGARQIATTSKRRGLLVARQCCARHSRAAPAADAVVGAARRTT